MEEKEEEEGVGVKRQVGVLAMIDIVLWFGWERMVLVKMQDRSAVILTAMGWNGIDGMISQEYIGNPSVNSPSCQAYCPAYSHTLYSSTAVPLRTHSHQPFPDYLPPFPSSPYPSSSPLPPPF